MNPIARRCLPLAAVLLAVPLVAGAQDVIASGGGEGSGGNHSMSWTIGQPVIKTVAAGGSTLTQGFQQPWADVTAVVDEHGSATLLIRAYPNPADHILNVDMPGTQGQYRLELLDAAGQLVLQAASVGEHTQLDLADQGVGLYFLRALDAEGMPVRTFKININH